MTALQQIIKEAKIIRKKYPNKAWKDAVKQASAIYASKHKGKSPVGKKKKIGKYVATKKSGSKTTVIYRNKKVSSKAPKKSVTQKTLFGVKKPISESKVLHEIDKVKHDIKTLEKLQKEHMMKKHKTSIGATIRKKHTEIKKLLKKY